MTSGKKVKVGIVGTGYTVGHAYSHVKGYLANPHAELVALYDLLPGRAKEWAKEKGLEEVRICDTYEELLNLVDAVSICTPNYAHVPMAIKAITMNKHVLCEKPMSVDAKTAAEALKYAKCSSVVSMIGFNYRGIPAVKLMKQLIAQGKIGQVFTYRQTLGGTRISNPEVKLEWRMQEDLSGSGALADFGSHMLDLADFLLRDVAGPIKEVNCMLETFIKERQIIGREEYGPVTTDDSATFLAKTTQGALLSFVASRLGTIGHTIEIHGSGGMMFFDAKRLKEVRVFFKDVNGGYTGKEEILEAPEEFVVEPWFNDEINVFIEAILQGKKVDRDFARGVYIQQLLDALREAAAKGTTITVEG